MKKSFLLFAALAVFYLGQEPRGTITGQVIDTTGAAVPGVTARATQVETNVTLGSVTNEHGDYEIPYALPGLYRMQAEMAGFKTWIRPRVELRSGDRLRIDIVMEVGQVTEVVEVTAEPPVLESLSRTVSQVITGRQATELPQRGGSLAWLYLLTPKVVLPSLPAGGPLNIDQASDISVGGGGRRSFDFNVDGVSNNAYESRAAFVPPPDMVQEIRV